MKKVILFLLLLTAAQTFAQIKKTVEFDFNNPTALTPSITPLKENAQTVQVTDKVFKNQGVSISFKADPTAPIGSRITTVVQDGTTSYYLKLSSISDMTFSVGNGTFINEISFSHDTEFGGLYLKEGEKGYIDPNEIYKKWVADNASVNSVTLRNTDQDSKFHQIYVTYTEPSDVLSPSSTNIAQGGEVASFDKFVLNFADNMSIHSSNGITLSNGTNKTWNLTVHASGNTVTLSAPSVINTDGTYTLTIPARCFKNTAGYENKALTYTFTVNTPKDIFNYASVNPAQGAIERLQSGIELTYPTYINVNTNTELVLKMNGKDLVPVKITKSAENSKVAILTFKGVNEGIADKGTYTITVPENTITNLMGSIHNPSFTLTYTIGEVTPTPDPKPDPTPEESETMKLAKQLVATVGAGYPAAESESRKTLKLLTEASTTVPSDEKLQAAIEAFYSESNVELPEAGKWYQIYGINNADNATRAYLSYSDGKVTLTTDKNAAAAFEVENHGTALSFKTIDGKYLHILTTNNNDYEGTSDKNVTDAYTSVNNLSLEKLNVANVEAKKQFGLFSIEGSLGKDILEKEEQAYALIQYSNKIPTIKTRVNFDILYNNDLSSAFAFTETSKPDEEIKTVETAFTITPDIVEKGGNLTLTFNGIENVKASDNIDAYIANASDERIESASVIASATPTNQFTISTDGFDNGNYQVVFPEGSFLYEKDGKTVQTQQIKKSFTIGKGGSGNDDNFDTTYNQVIVKPSVNNYIKDSDLNNFTIRIINGDYTGLVADPKKTVRIAKYNNNQTIVTGHFEPSTESESGYTIIKLVLDSPINEGSFAANLYAVVIEEGTFGDANFGKYLNDKTSVNAKDCKVNPRMNLNYNVDNNIATSINDITTDTNLPTVIYDLMGRRVRDMSRPGIYIVNGKKVVKK